MMTVQVRFRLTKDDVVDIVLDKIGDGKLPSRMDEVRKIVQKQLHDGGKDVAYRPRGDRSFRACELRKRVYDRIETLFPEWP
jgi:hypothetical protein